MRRLPVYFMMFIFILFIDRLEVFAISEYQDLYDYLHINEFTYDSGVYVDGQIDQLSISYNEPYRVQERDTLNVYIQNYSNQYLYSFEYDNDILVNYRGTNGTGDTTRSILSHSAYNFYMIIPVCRISVTAFPRIYDSCTVVVRPNFTNEVSSGVSTLVNHQTRLIGYYVSTSSGSDLQNVDSQGRIWCEISGEGDNIFIYAILLSTISSESSSTGGTLKGLYNITYNCVGSTSLVDAVGEYYMSFSDIQIIEGITGGEQISDVVAQISTMDGDLTAQIRQLRGANLTTLDSIYQNITDQAHYVVDSLLEATNYQPDGDAGNQNLQDSFDQYEQAETAVTDYANNAVSQYDFSSTFQFSTDVAGSIGFLSSFFVSLIAGMGDFALPIYVGVALIMVAILIGVMRYRS